MTEMAGRYSLGTNPRTGKPFMLGDHVAKGQVIVELEDEEYVNNLGMEAKELNLRISEQNYTKQKSLFDKGGVTLQRGDYQIALLYARHQGCQWNRSGQPDELRKTAVGS